jgi:hypothetical protein
MLCYHCVSYEAYWNNVGISIKNMVESEWDYYDQSIGF